MILITYPRMVAAVLPKSRSTVTGHTCNVIMPTVNSDRQDPHPKAVFSAERGYLTGDITSMLMPKCGDTDLRIYIGLPCSRCVCVDSTIHADLEVDYQC
jgi:hypothetical protein